MDNMSKKGGGSLPLWGSMRWNVHYPVFFCGIQKALPEVVPQHNRRYNFCSIQKLRKVNLGELRGAFHRVFSGDLVLQREGDALNCTFGVDFGTAFWRFENLRPVGRRFFVKLDTFLGQ